MNHRTQRTLPLLSMIAFFMLQSFVGYGQTFFEQLPEPAGGHVHAVECNANGDPVCLTKTRIYRWDPAKSEWEVAQSFWTDSNDKKLYRAPNGRLFACAVTARLYASDDDGATWTKLTGLNEYSRDITATASGALFNAGNGVKMSTDEGVSWTNRSQGLEGEYLQGITVHTNGTLFACAALTGIFRSSDEGLNWELITDSPTYMYDVFVTSKGTVWAVGNDGAFSSTDLGNTWTLSGAPTRVKSITEHPTGDLYVTATGGGDRMLRSTDDGSTWTAIANYQDGSQPHNIAFNAAGRGFCATWKGISTSADGIEAWQSRNNGLRVTDIPAIVEDTEKSLILSNNGIGLFRSTDRGQSWRPLTEESPMTNIHSLLRSHDSLFAASYDWLYLSTDHGLNWQKLNPDDRFASCYGVLIDGAGMMYIAKGNGISFSSDGGTQWEERNGGLPDCGFPGIGMFSDGSVLGASYDDGVFRSTDQGQNWTTVTGLPDGMRYLSIATDWDNTVYLGTRGHGCYRSTDRGVNWEQIIAGFDNRYVRDLFVSESGSVYASTNTGVFLLEKSSDTWIRLSGIDYQCNVFYENSDHDFFVGTTSEGLYRSRDPLPALPPATPAQLLPANGASEIGTHTAFTWQNTPAAMYYKLQISTQPDMSGAEIDSSIAAIDSLHLYNLTLPMKYYWRIAAGNIAGESAWSQIWSFNTGQVTSVSDLTATSFQLAQNYPNPCTASTVIRFSMQDAASVNLSVYSVLGQKLLTVLDGHVESGIHDIPLRITLPPGVYVYRLRTENGSMMRRFIVME